MGEAGVTYADLRFVKSPPAEQSRPPRGASEEGSDGELTYENFPAGPTRPGPGPGPAQQAPRPARQRLRSAAPLAACLFLLATCIGLGVRYWQVSWQLQGALERHAAESSTLAHRIGGQEENLTRFLQQLSQARAELNTTRLALWQSWQVGNGTRQQLEEELEQVKNRLTRLQQEKEEAIQQLQATKRVLDHVASCQQNVCCPTGWKLLDQKCLWISSGERAWEESKQDCEGRGAQLLILKPWNDNTVWDIAVIMRHLQAQEFWIGLTRKEEWGWKWCWVDGTPYPHKNLDSYYYNCGKVNRGILAKDSCQTHRRSVCEMAATPLPWSGEADARNAHQVFMPKAKGHF